MPSVWPFAKRSRQQIHGGPTNAHQVSSPPIVPRLWLGETSGNRPWIMCNINQDAPSGSPPNTSMVRCMPSSSLSAQTCGNTMAQHIARRPAKRTGTRGIASQIFSIPDLGLPCNLMMPASQVERPPSLAQSTMVQLEATEEPTGCLGDGRTLGLVRRKILHGCPTKPVVPDCTRSLPRFSWSVPVPLPVCEVRCECIVRRCAPTRFRTRASLPGRTLARVCLEARASTRGWWT